jgi:hypothetical protein
VSRTLEVGWKARWSSWRSLEGACALALAVAHRRSTHSDRQFEVVFFIVSGLIDGYVFEFEYPVELAAFGEVHDLIDLRWYRQVLHDCIVFEVEFALNLVVFAIKSHRVNPFVDLPDDHFAEHLLELGGRCPRTHDGSIGLIFCIGEGVAALAESKISQLLAEDHVVDRSLRDGQHTAPTAQRIGHDPVHVGVVEQPLFAAREPYIVVDFAQIFVKKDRSEYQSALRIAFGLLLDAEVGSEPIVFGLRLGAPRGEHDECSTGSSA